MRTTRPDWLADVHGADVLFDWFGYWPDFHDAEVLRIDLNRDGTSSVRIHTWETTDQVDEQGYRRQRKHVIVSFLLDEVADLDLSGFSNQNVISGVKISKSKDGFCLSLGPCYGLAGCITAATVKIQIEPRTKNDPIQDSENQ
jgi:hypothetical protein